MARYIREEYINKPQEFVDFIMKDFLTKHQFEQNNLDGEMIWQDGVPGNGGRLGRTAWRTVLHTNRQAVALQRHHGHCRRPVICLHRSRRHRLRIRPLHGQS